MNNAQEKHMTNEKKIIIQDLKTKFSKELLKNQAGMKIELENSGNKLQNSRKALHTMDQVGDRVSEYENTLEELHHKSKEYGKKCLKYMRETCRNYGTPF